MRLSFRPIKISPNFLVSIYMKPIEAKWEFFQLGLRPIRKFYDNGPHPQLRGEDHQSAPNCLAPSAPCQFRHES